MGLLKDLVKIHQKVTFGFASNNLRGLIPLYDFGYANTFRNQKVFKPIATGNVKDENVNFLSNKTSSMSEKTKIKQSLPSSKISSSHQVPSYQINTTSKLNEYINKYINKLTLPSFNSFLPAISCSIILQHL